MGTEGFEPIEKGINISHDLPSKFLANMPTEKSKIHKKATYDHKENKRDRDPKNTGAYQQPYILIIKGII